MRLSALLGTTLAFGANAAGDEAVPFREAWGWAVVVPVAVRGSGVHEMLLDTGTTSTILETALAAELGTGPTARARLLWTRGSARRAQGTTAPHYRAIPLPARRLLALDGARLGRRFVPLRRWGIFYRRSSVAWLSARSIRYQARVVGHETVGPFA